LGVFLELWTYSNSHSSFNSGSEYKYFVIKNDVATSAIQSTVETNFEKSGLSVRLLRPATEAEQLLDDGTACDYYHGTDGKVYRTVKIGTQVWLADNLAETMLPETSYIDGWSAEGYVPISDVDWAAKTSEALCCYNDQITNI
jgi:hypothetical protein